MSRAVANAISISIAQEVEKYPILWDCSLESYKRADLKPPVWQIVADNINLRHESAAFNAESAKKKFKDIKEIFFKNYRKVKECQNKCSGNGSDDMFEPAWPVYKHCLFLIKTGAQAASTSNIKEKTTDSEISIPSIYFDDNDKLFHSIPNNEDSTSSVLSCLLVPQGPSSAPASLQMARPETPSGAKPSQKRPAEDTFFNKKGDSKRTHAGFLHEAVKVLTKIADEPPPQVQQIVPPENDGIVMFISQRLKGLDKEARRACENELLDVIRKY